MSTATLAARRTAHAKQDDACPLCGYWRCRCGGATLAPPTSGPLFVTAEDDGQADEALRRAREADKRRAEVNR